MVQDSSEDPAPVLPLVKRWGVARTKARAEKVFGEFLCGLGVPFFLPLIRRVRTYGRQKRFSDIPLFPGYVFFDRQGCEVEAIWSSRRVAQILDPPDSGAMQRELQNLALALSVDRSLRLERFKTLGMPVEVLRGTFKGVVGELVRFEGKSRLVIRISFIRQAAELTIDDSMVEPLLHRA